MLAEGKQSGEPEVVAVADAGEGEANAQIKQQREKRENGRAKEMPKSTLVILAVAGGVQQQQGVSSLHSQFGGTGITTIRHPSALLTRRPRPS